MSVPIKISTEESKDTLRFKLGDTDVQLDDLREKIQMLFNLIAGMNGNDCDSVSRIKRLEAEIEKLKKQPQ